VNPPGKSETAEISGATIGSVEPSSGYPGTLVKIRLRETDSTAYISSGIIVDGVDYLLGPIWKDSMSFHMPYVLPTTDLRIRINVPGSGLSVERKVDFTPLGIQTTGRYTVAWWRPENHVDSTAASFGPITWQYSSWGDTVLLELQGKFEGGIRSASLVMRDQAPGQLPEFVRFVRRYPAQDTLQAGLIQIDQWHEHGVVSGCVFGDPSRDSVLNFTQFYFYAVRP
jgi:hypothetical protein